MMRSSNRLKSSVPGRPNSTTVMSLARSRAMRSSVSGDRHSRLVGVAQVVAIAQAPNHGNVAAVVLGETVEVLEQVDRRLDLLDHRVQCGQGSVVLPEPVCCCGLRLPT